MKPKYTFVIYKDKKGEFRWTCFAANGRKVADSTEGYKRKKAAMTYPLNTVKMNSNWHGYIEIIDETKPKKK